MKKHYKHFAVLGTLCCIAALVVLWMAVLSVDWVSIQEPQVDQSELDKLAPYEEARPHLIRAKFGLFKMCLQQLSSHGSSAQQLKSGGGGQSPYECHDLDWYNFGVINFDPSRKPPPMPTELIANCVEKLRFTLPFIGLSVLFTSISFLCLTFGHFCQKNKKIIEASMLILGGLCQATALLTFVAQIGSEFEANLPFSHHQSRLTTFYRYKYGYSFYLFLLSFGLSELGAFFDMLAYFRKYPPNHYIITFHRQEPSPFMGNSTANHHPRPNHNTLPNTSSAAAALHHHHLHHHHLPNPQYHTLPNHHHPPLKHHHPDLCTDHDYSGGADTGALVDSGIPLPPQSYMNQEVTITTIERGTGLYGTLRNVKVPGTATMESFGTMRKENNI